MQNPPQPPLRLPKNNTKEVKNIMVKQMYDGFGNVYEACEKNVGMEIICPECGDTVKCVKNYVCGFQDEDKDVCWEICKLKYGKKDFGASAKEYYNVDSERRVCLDTGKCNPKIYRQIYYNWSHNHSADDYGDCYLRFSISANLKRLKTNVANFYGIFDDWKDFIESDDTMINNVVFCVTQKHFKKVFEKYGYEKIYIFDRKKFEKWSNKTFHKYISGLDYNNLLFFDVKDNKICEYNIINYAPNSDRFIFTNSGKVKISRSMFI